MIIPQVCRVLAFGAALLAQPVLAALPAEPCPMSGDANGTSSDLGHVAAVLHGTKKLEVLAVGSATMFGPEASLAPGTVTSQVLGNGVATDTGKILTQQPSERAFPLQMARNLRTLFPGVEVQVSVRGGRGLLATEMLDLLRKELTLKRYDLVVWQTGTVEAVRNLPPSEFGQTLSDGAQAVQEAGGDLILVDPQFSRFLQTNSNLDPYFQALQQVSSMPGVVLFHRFDLMRGWANDGGIDLERTSRADRQKAIETLHACLGRHLARLVAASARS